MTLYNLQIYLVFHKEAFVNELNKKSEHVNTSTRINESMTRRILIVVFGIIEVLLEIAFGYTIKFFKFFTNTFKDKIYVADFFFTSCTTICPTMHRNMKTVYEEFKNNPDIMFLSHTIDFKYDTPSVLKKYAEKLGVNDKRWQFAYGNKDQIYSLAEKNYLTVVEEDSTARDGYIHQGWFVLIDKHKRMRGAYDGTKTEQVDQLKKDLVILLAEEKN